MRSLPQKSLKMFKGQKNLSFDYHDNGNYNQSYIRQTKKKKPRGDFRNYCFNLMKKSLITGFPAIAESKSSIRRTVKSLLLLVCTVGYFYQAFNFLQIYLEYPTLMDFSIEHPEQIEAPAVTICNHNRLWRQRFCKVFPEGCEFKYDNWDDFCKAYPIYCPSEKPRDPVFARFKSESFRWNRSNEVLDAVGPQTAEDVIGDCSIYVNDYPIPCENFFNFSAIPIQVSLFGSTYKCFSLFSLLGKPNAVSRNLTLSDKYHIIITLHPEEYMEIEPWFNAYIFVHDPRAATNPMADGINLLAGNFFQFYATMEKRESLPYPYKSNCTDYLALWKANGGYGPITKRGCTEWCKIQAMLNEYGCVASSITYPNNFTYCSNRSIVSSDEVNAKCSASCNDACESSHYTLTSEYSREFAKKICEKTDEHCLNSFVEVMISFSRFNIQKSEHIPKFQSVELFGYIGGYMGMWIGISLVSLFDFIEMLVDVLAYQVMKYKKNKRRINQVEKFQRNISYDTYDV